MAVLLGYEAVLASTPPNNMDSLTYHLARAAAWTQHGGIYWIANAPEVELNAYQPFAELQDFFLMVATGGGRLYALPQYLSELAILVSIYGSARRLGYAVRPSTCAAALTATFSVLALEAVTGQNDLFAASFPAVAACLLLGAVPAEAALAGAAVAFGIGTKLTTGLVTPILAWLALARGRRTFFTALLGGLAGLVTIGMWGYVLNVVHTGHVFGAGTGGVQDRANPRVPAKRRERVLPGLRADGHLGALLPRHPLARAPRRGAGGGRVLWWLRRGHRRDAVERARGSRCRSSRRCSWSAGPGWLRGAPGWGFPIRGPGGLLGPLDANLNETYTESPTRTTRPTAPSGSSPCLARPCWP